MGAIYFQETMRLWGVSGASLSFTFVILRLHSGDLLHECDESAGIALAGRNQYKVRASASLRAGRIAMSAGVRPAVLGTRTVLIAAPRSSMI